MRVLLQSRRTLYSVPGGDTVQIEETARALRNLGYSADISLEFEPDLTAYDLVHIFNLSRPQEGYLQALNAKRQNKPVALSTIHVDYDEYERVCRTGITGLVARNVPSSTREYLKVGARAVVNGEFHNGIRALLLQGYRDLQCKLLQLCSVLLPNSQSELLRVQKDFDVARNTPFVVVPNGIAPDVFLQGNGANDDFAKYDNSILCVARFEGRKNQLNLVRAARDLPWPLVLIGKPAPNHEKYRDQVAAEAGPNTHFIGQIEQARLPGFYSASKVHALVSWMETTGLSSLEAGLYDCNLVITDKGDTRDYFGDFAFYCDPNDVASIRAALIRAHQSPRTPHLRERILQRFTWAQAAKETTAGYEVALGVQKQTVLS